MWETITGTMQSPPQLDPDRWERVKTLWVGSVSSVEEIVFQGERSSSHSETDAPRTSATIPASRRCINEGLILRFLHASGRAEGIPKLLAMGMLPSGCPALVLERLGDSLAEHLGDCGPQSSKDRQVPVSAFPRRVGNQPEPSAASTDAVSFIAMCDRTTSLFGLSFWRSHRTDGPQVYLIDFGLAKVFHPAVFCRSRREVMTSWEPICMAPSSGICKHVTAQADIYSLGVVLYLLCCGPPSV